MDKLKILLAEDEENVSKFIELELVHEGYDVTVAFDGKTAFNLFEKEDWDLILLDWMLPMLDGLEICRRIRKKSAVPIIIITARDYLGDKIAGLDTGADDYITKPFDIEELLARIRSVTRRYKPIDQNQEGFIRVADLDMDLLGRRVTREGVLIDLTPREFNLLYFLIKNQGIVLSRDQVLSEVWGYDFDGGTNVVDVYVRYLRNKLDRHYRTKLIHTIRGVGYVLRPETES
ncbi:response regulator transcription factor [Metabacillus sp. RGM 3146]|uniref:response regulator transcription factor n=1 Tax=Metabacillus sp. RGM 3146 TaxID=3401092 RepID=UPI003B9CEEDF